MDHVGLWCEASKRLLGGGVSRQDFGWTKYSLQRIELMVDLWNGAIGHTHEEWSPETFGQARALQARRQHPRAGRIRDFDSFDEWCAARIDQRVEWQVMQHAVRHDDESPGVNELVGGRIDQRRVQLGQDAVDALQQVAVVGSNVRASKPELARVKSKAIHELRDPTAGPESICNQLARVEH